MNPNKATDREDLYKAIQASEQALLSHRNRYRRQVEKYAGRKRGRDGDKEGPPMVNRLFQAVSADYTLLSSGRPQFTLTSKVRRNQHFANRLQFRLNAAMDEICFEETLQMVVAAASFGPGVAKAYRADSALVRLGENSYADPGRPFIGYVSFGRYFLDMEALQQGEIDFEGDVYDVDWERLLDDSLFDKKVTSKLKPDSELGYRYDGDDGTARETPAEGGGRGRRKKVRLRDVWLPREKMLVTYTERMDTPPLRVLEPDEGEAHYGPYEKLWYDPVPDNTLPISAADVLERLHDHSGFVWRKLQMQAAQQRDVNIYESMAAETANSLRTKQHGEWAQVDNIDKIGKFSVPGPDPNVAKWSQIVDSTFDEMGGFVRQKFGGSTGVPTATEASLNSQAIGAVTAKKLYRVLKFCANCGKRMARMLMADTLETSARRQYLNLPGFPQYQYPAHWTSRHRLGSVDDYDFEVVPHSVTFKTPREQLNDLLGFLKEFGVPLDQAFAARGMQLRPDKLLGVYAELVGTPQLYDLYDVVDPNPEAQPVSGEPGRTPPAGPQQAVRRSEAVPVRPTDLVDSMQPAEVL